MRIKAMSKVHKLKDKFLAIDPDTIYVAMTTTWKGEKGRFLGYTTGDATVGVFSKANTNIASIAIKGVINKENEMNVEKFIDIFKDEGFIETTEQPKYTSQPVIKVYK